MAGHIWHDCGCDKTEDGTPVCGLGRCIVCGGQGASLTTDCCGRELTVRESSDVMCKEIDFRGGKWWELEVKNVPPMKPKSFWEAEKDK